MWPRGKVEQRRVLWKAWERISGGKNPAESQRPEKIRKSGEEGVDGKAAREVHTGMGQE